MEIDNRVTSELEAAHFIVGYLQSATKNPSLSIEARMFAKDILIAVNREYPIMDISIEEDTYFYPSVVNNVSH